MVGPWEGAGAAGLTTSYLPQVHSAPVVTRSVEMNYFTLTYQRKREALGLLKVETERSIDLGTSDP